MKTKKECTNVVIVKSGWITLNTVGYPNNIANIYANACATNIETLF